MVQPSNPDVVEARRRLIQQGYVDPTTGEALRPSDEPPDAPPEPRTPPSPELEVLRSIDQRLGEVSHAVGTIRSIAVFFLVVWIIGAVLSLFAILAAASS
jgi:hypothetical protein